MKWSIGVYRTDTPEGEKDYVSGLPHEHVFAHGLAAKAIVGVLLRPLGEGEAITPEVFARSPAFVKFLHEVIARRAPGLPAFVAAARRQQDGWIYVVDQRTRDAHGEVPPEDIVGRFEVKAGLAVQDSYESNPRHLILSGDGFFRLGPDLESYLLEELIDGRRSPQRAD